MKMLNSLFVTLLAGVLALVVMAIGVSHWIAPEDHAAMYGIRGPSGERQIEGNAKPPRLADTAFVGAKRTHWSPLDDVGTNRRCNQDILGRAQNECPLAADPTDFDILLAGANDYTLGGDFGTGFYCSVDGGNTWRHGLSGSGPANGNCSSIFDPTIAIDANGRMFAAYMATACNHPHNGAYLNYSDDHGQTWSDPTTIATVVQINSQIDRPMIACDISPDSPYRNYVYAVWLGAHAHFTRSTDGGETFMEPIIISSESDAIMPCLATGPLGEIYVAWIDMWDEELRFRRSLNGGLNWQPELVLGDCDPHMLYNDQNCNSGYRMTNYPVPAADISNGPHRGTVYIVYAHNVNGDENDIYLRKSVDNGLTWSEPLQLNDDNTTRQQWWPWIAVHPRTGDVAVAWCDRRDDAANCDFAFYGTISTDGGETWCENIRISDQQLETQNRGFLGDYTGLTFSNLGFHGAWPDTRNDYSDIYSAWWNETDSLALTVPNGGEIWSAQQPCTARWEFRYAPDTMFVELSRNYPNGAWERLDTVTSSLLEWAWTPNTPATTIARLRIIGQHHTEVGDTSDANFMINALSAPTRLTAIRIGTDIHLRWLSTGVPWYHIYSAASAADSFSTLEGVTSNTTFVDVNAAMESEQKFYIVRASEQP